MPACGKNVETQIRDSVRQFDGLDLASSQVEIVDVKESGDFAIAELKVSTAVKLKKEKGRWLIDEVRLGDRQWEKAATILAALESRRSDETRQLLSELAGGVGAYRALQGRVPPAQDFESLVDLLTPRYMDHVIRLDSWSRPFAYQALSEQTFDLRSAGPDGLFETADDIVWKEAE